ncbi:S8 family serine peptidase, partial [archaeon]|nr:S8 family serine peptidase [archaeon]
MKRGHIILLLIFLLIFFGFFSYNGEIISNKAIVLEKKLIFEEIFDPKEGKIKALFTPKKGNIQEEINNSQLNNITNTTDNLELILWDDYYGSNPIPGVIKVKFKENVNVDTPELAKKAIESVKTNESNFTEGIIIEKKLIEPKDPKKKQIWNEIGLNRWMEIKIEPTLDVLSEIEKWKELPNVETAEPRYHDSLILFPNEYNFYKKWDLHNTGDNFADIGQWSINITEDADIDAPEAWDITTGNGIIIGNPDQSVMWYHKDLVNNVIKNLGEDADGDGVVIIYNGTTSYEFWSGDTFYNNTYPSYYFDPDDVNGIDDDENGKIDDFIGWDFVSNDNEPSNTLTHGTQTSGVIAAEANNAYSVMGVCWNCTIIPSRTTGRLDEGIIYDVNMGARVITLSWKCIGINPPTDVIDAVEYATQNNVSVIFGAANDGTSYTNSYCKIKESICVTGTNWFDRLWEGSASGDTNYGPKSDVGAPAALFTTNAITSTNYPHTFSEGTSLAAPTVAGVIGLMLSINPDLTPLEVKSVVQTAVDPFVQKNKYAGNGRINAHKAVLLSNQSLQYGSFPVTLIDANSTKQEDSILNIYGISKSPNFLKYQIYYGQEVYPEDWILIEEVNLPIEGGLIYQINTNYLPLGAGQLKIITLDTNNQFSQDTYPLFIASSVYNESNQCIDLDGDEWSINSTEDACNYIGLLGYGDCDDTNIAINPGATEVCDGLDNDCNIDTSDGSGESNPSNSLQYGVCSGSV